MMPRRTQSGLSAITTRQVLYDVQGGVCFYCDRRMTMTQCGSLTATVEHRRPRAAGGSDRRDNLVASCERCNSAKGGMTEAEFVAAVRSGHWRYRGIELSERAIATAQAQVRKEWAA